MKNTDFCNELLNNELVHDILGNEDQPEEGFFIRLERHCMVILNKLKHSQITINNINHILVSVNSVKCCYSDSYCDTGDVVAELKLDHITDVTLA